MQFLERKLVVTTLTWMTSVTGVADLTSGFTGRWVALGPSGLYWALALLGCSGMCWSVLDYNGLYWAALGSTELNRATLDSNRLCWALLGYTGLHWAVPDISWLQ